MKADARMLLMDMFNFKYSLIAKELGVTRSVVRRWVLKDNGFPLERARQIEELTNKRIKAEDLTRDKISDCSQKSG